MGFLALAFSISVIACDPAPKRGNDGVDTTVTDSSTIVSHILPTNTSVTKDSAGADTTLNTAVKKTETKQQ